MLVCKILNNPCNYRAYKNLEFKTLNMYVFTFSKFWYSKNENVIKICKCKVMKFEIRVTNGFTMGWKIRVLFFHLKLLKFETPLQISCFEILKFPKCLFKESFYKYIRKIVIKESLPSNRFLIKHSNETNEYKKSRLSWIDESSWLLYWK